MTLAVDWAVKPQHKIYPKLCMCIIGLERMCIDQTLAVNLEMVIDFINVWLAGFSVRNTSKLEFWCLQRCFVAPLSRALLVYLSHVIRKPVYAICKKRCRSACASMQSDKRLYCLLLRWYNTYSSCIQNFKTLASFCSWAGWLESYLVANPEDRFSHDVAHFMIT